MGYWKYVDTVESEGFYFPNAFTPGSSTRLTMDSTIKTIIQTSPSNHTFMGGFYTYTIPQTLNFDNLSTCVTQSGPVLAGGGLSRKNHNIGRWTNNQIVSFVETLPSPYYLRITASDGATVAARYVGGIAWDSYYAQDVSVYEISTNYYCVVRILTDYYGAGSDLIQQFILPRNAAGVFNNVAARTITNTEVRSWKETHIPNSFDDGETLWGVTYNAPPTAPVYTNLGASPYFKYTKERIVMQQIGATLSVNGLLVNDIVSAPPPVADAPLTVGADKDIDLWAVKHTTSVVSDHTFGTIDVSNVYGSKLKNAAFTIPEEFTVVFPEGNTRVWANYAMHPIISGLDYPHIVTWGGDFFAYNQDTGTYEQIINTLNWNYSKCELLNSEAHKLDYVYWYPPFLYFWYQDGKVYSIVYDLSNTYSFYEYTEDRGRVTCGPHTTSGQKYWGKYGNTSSWIKTKGGSSTWIRT